MDVSMPKNNGEWLFLAIVIVATITAANVLLIYDIDKAVAGQDIILADIPTEIKMIEEKLDHIDKNIIILCLELDVDECDT